MSAPTIEPSDARVDGDLLSCDAVYSNVDLLCWLPRASHTRTQARQRFWRETNDADWEVAWTEIRVVARFVRMADDHHPNEGRYVQCGRDEAGATAVWRCETLGRDGKPMPETSVCGVCRP